MDHRIHPLVPEYWGGITDPAVKEREVKWGDPCFGFRTADHTGAQELHVLGGNKGVTANPQPARTVAGPQVYFAPLDTEAVGFQEFLQLMEHDRGLLGRRSNQGDVVSPSHMGGTQRYLALVKETRLVVPVASADTATFAR